MSDLSDTVQALDAIHVDLSALEAGARKHAEDDDQRFRQLQGDKGMAGVHAKLAHLENMITLLHDNIIEGFRQQNIRLEKRGMNGR